MNEPIILAIYFHPHGFHRDIGKFPGIDLYEKLKPLLEDPDSKIVIDLTEMKTLYGSFVDGAFGLFIDKYRDNFFNKISFINSKPEFEIVINRVFNRHKDKNFNAGLQYA